MTIRSFIFWLHLAAGVVAGTVVLVMSVTGVLLTYEKQMVAWAERSPLAAAPTPDAPRLPLEALMARVREARPSASPATLTFRANRDEPVTVALGRDGQLLLNAYTGAVIGEGAVRPARVLPLGHRLASLARRHAASTGRLARRSPAPATSRFSSWS